MKARVDRAATERVLADIADAVRPVDRARTAAAVERVLRTASPGVFENAWGYFNLTQPLSVELGFTLADDRFGCQGPCDGCDTDTAVDLPGLTYYIDSGLVPGRERRRYAPWVVSPHLFAEVTP